LEFLLKKMYYVFAAISLGDIWLRSWKISCRFRRRIRIELGNTDTCLPEKTITLRLDVDGLGWPPKQGGGPQRTASTR
jgi:hypothetical protein